MTPATAAATAPSAAATAAGLAVCKGPSSDAVPCIEAEGARRGNRLQSATEADWDHAVDVTIKALARSVAVRCQCIDQHTPHPDQQRSSGADTLSPQADTNWAGVNPSEGAGAGTVPGPSAAGADSRWVCASHHRAHATAVEAIASSQSGGTGVSAQQAEHGTDPTARGQLVLQNGQAELQTREPSHGRRSPQAQLQHGDTHAPAQTEAQTSDPLLQPAGVLILFSGGVDSTLIAALAHQSLPIDVPVDLASVCFNGGQSADRLAAHDALRELMLFAPARQWRLIEVDSCLEEVDLHRHWLLGKLLVTHRILSVYITPCFNF